MNPFSDNLGNILLQTVGNNDPSLIGIPPSNSFRNPAVSSRAAANEHDGRKWDQVALRPSRSTISELPRRVRTAWRDEHRDGSPNANRWRLATRQGTCCNRLISGNLFRVRKENRLAPPMRRNVWLRNRSLTVNCVIHSYVKSARLEVPERTERDKSALRGVTREIGCRPRAYGRARAAWQGRLLPA